jgi:hypothetical protein
MNYYFWVAQNRGGVFKSGVVVAATPAEAHKISSKAATTFSDDAFIITKLERIE